MRRIESVDVFKLLAITAVIAIHTTPFGSNSSRHAEVWKYLNVLVDQLARFAVPFFFVISGYFWGKKVNNNVSVAPVSVSMAKKIFLIFVVWSIVYATPYNITSMMDYGLSGPVKLAYWNLIGLMGNPVILLMEGTKVHLWFLIAMLCSLGITSVLVGKKYFKTLIILSVALYLIGMLAKAYSDTPLGIKIDFNTRYGPFFGTIFFASGYFLSRLMPTPGWFSKGVAIFGVGCLLHFSEIYLLWTLYGTSLHQEYVIGTYFMGVGAAVISLSNNPLFRNSFLSEIGKYTLGIYVIHYIFVDLLRPLAYWSLGYTALVLLFSAASVIVLSINKFTRKIII